MLSCLDKDRIGEIESLYLQPNYRGLGIGRELVQRAVGWLKQQQARAIRLNVLEANKEAITFYQRLGFKIRVLEMMIPNR